MCLVVIDAHSKWLEAAFVSSATSVSVPTLLILVYQLRWYQTMLRTLSVKTSNPSSQGLVSNI